MKLVLAGGGLIFDAVREMVCSGGLLHEYDTWRSIPKNMPIGAQDLVGMDLLLCIGHPQILTKELLDRPTLGCVNLHTSLLPAYRGRHPVQWAMINGESTIGVTLHYMDEGIDTGDIILQWPVRIARNDDLPVVMDKLVSVSCRIVRNGLAQLRQGRPMATKQPLTDSYWPRRTPEDSRIDWNQTSQDVARFINALADPRFYAFSGDTQYSRADLGNAPGELVAETTDRRQVIATGDGVVLVRPVRTG